MLSLKQAALMGPWEPSEKMAIDINSLAPGRFQFILDR